MGFKKNKIYLMRKNMDIKETIKNKINVLEKEKQELAESDIWIEQALKLALAIEIKIDILKELLEEIEEDNR
ncbi:intermediate filament C protein [Pseudoleptotrichia goodfellowii]|uniref:Intermediate filament C protein n=2 Tax=Pseudoleptotrichia goodfellowii TaxID=157692 RepID=A0A510J8A7_9FUSO|nr:hypothetical protein [Pseudoleptotrichia goodfellowii]BBM35404.1 intermediate filament C protein [Pseudoleptotrichia goodfellowii]